jgi:hypothetical protein
MNIQRFLPGLLAALLATPLYAQSAGKPLNLKLPPSDIPAASTTAAPRPHDAAAGSTATSHAHDAPGTYYGDTSGRMGNDLGDTAEAPDCDDSTYNEPQVHGSVGMGVVGGNHVSGNYQTGTVNVSKAFGSCDDPSGGINISIGAGTGHFHDRHRH